MLVFFNSESPIDFGNSDGEYWPANITEGFCNESRHHRSLLQCKLLDKLPFLPGYGDASETSYFVVSVFTMMCSYTFLGP